MFPYTDNRVNTDYERIASCGGCQCWNGDPIILQAPLAAHCCSQRPSHSAITDPSKTDWHQLSGITYCLKQWYDSRWNAIRHIKRHVTYNRNDIDINISHIVRLITSQNKLEILSSWLHIRIDKSNTKPDKIPGETKMIFDASLAAYHKRYLLIAQEYSG